MHLSCSRGFHGMDNPGNQVDEPGCRVPRLQLRFAFCGVFEFLRECILVIRNKADLWVNQHFYSESFAPKLKIDVVPARQAYSHSASVGRR